MIASATFVPKRAEGCEASRLGSDFILLDGSGKTLRGLNRTAARVWELIDGQRTVEEISNRLAMEFGTSTEQVVKDVSGFVSSLIERQLLAASIDHPLATEGEPR